MAKQLPQGQFEISDGPSKFDFIMSACDGKKVKFTCNIGSSPKFQPRLQVFVRMVGAVDGGYDRWKGTITFIDDNYESSTRSFYYNTQDRKGMVHDAKCSWVNIAQPNVTNIVKKF